LRVRFRVKNCNFSKKKPQITFALFIRSSQIFYTLVLVVILKRRESEGSFINLWSDVLVENAPVALGTNKSSVSPLNCKVDFLICTTHIVREKQ